MTYKLAQILGEIAWKQKKKKKKHAPICKHMAQIIVELIDLWN
jgi:hypothetical protein